MRVAERGSRPVWSGGAERGVSAECSGAAASLCAAAMSSDFESYEQDFAVLTAEITGRIGKVPKLVGGERRAPEAELGLEAAGLTAGRGRGLPALLAALTALTPHSSPVLLVCESLCGCRSLRHPSGSAWEGVGVF